MDTSLDVDESQQMAISSRMSTRLIAITKLNRWLHSKDGSKAKQAMLRTHNEYESEDEYKPSCECSSNGKYKPDSRHRPNVNTSQLVNKDKHNGYIWDMLVTLDSRHTTLDNKTCQILLIVSNTNTI